MEIVVEENIKFNDDLTYSGHGYWLDGQFYAQGCGRIYRKDKSLLYVHAKHNILDGPAMSFRGEFVSIKVMKFNKVYGWGVMKKKGKDPYLLKDMIIGFFKDDKMTFDATPYVQWYIEIMKRLHRYIDNIFPPYFGGYGFFCGYHPWGEYRGHFGFQFDIAGNMWMGSTGGFNQTGLLMKFGLDGHITMGQFDEGKLVSEPMDLPTFICIYCGMSSDERYKINKQCLIPCLSEYPDLYEKYQTLNIVCDRDYSIYD